MQKDLKTSWINTPVSADVKQRARLAAALEACTLSEFVRRAVEARLEQSPAAKMVEAGQNGKR